MGNFRHLQQEMGDRATVKACVFNGKTKGLHIKFPNNYVVSVQCGAGNYADHYDKDFYADIEWMDSATAEIAYWQQGGDMLAFDDGDTVQGYQSYDDVMNFIAKVEALS